MGTDTVVNIGLGGCGMERSGSNRTLTVRIACPREHKLPNHVSIPHFTELGHSPRHPPSSPHSNSQR